MNVLSTLKVMPETKAEVKKFGESLIQSIQFGEVNALEMDGRLKALEELINIVRKSQEMSETLIIEAEKHGQKSFEYGNFKYQIKEVGTKYDFTLCNDTEWEQLKSEEESVKKKIKEREMMLKTIKHDTVLYNSDGVQLEAPIKTSTTKVVTLLK